MTKRIPATALAALATFTLAACGDPKPPASGPDPTADPAANPTKQCYDDPFDPAGCDTTDDGVPLGELDDSRARYNSQGQRLDDDAIIVSSEPPAFPQP